MNVLMVGGAGAMASGSVRDMVASHSRHIQEIIVADTSLERARRFTEQLGDPRLKPVKLDVNDGGELRALLQRVDVCVNAVPVFAGHHMAIFEACFEMRRTYVDFGGMGIFTVKQKAFHDCGFLHERLSYAWRHPKPFSMSAAEADFASARKQISRLTMLKIALALRADFGESGKHFRFAAL